MSTNKQLSQRLFDACMRVDRVIFLAGAVAAGDAFCDDLDAFLDDTDEEIVVACLGPIPDDIDLSYPAYERAELVSTWLYTANKLGFLVQVATPVMTRMSLTSRHFSWGYYNTQWLYGDTMDEVVSKAVDWAQKRRDAEDAKAEEAKNAKGGAA